MDGPTAGSVLRGADAAARITPRDVARVVLVAVALSDLAVLLLGDVFGVVPIACLPAPAERLAWSACSAGTGAGIEPVRPTAVESGIVETLFFGTSALTDRGG
jgi:hypothetical protein